MESSPDNNAKVRPLEAEFAVVGAGLLGLSAAGALRRRGHDVVVLERATVAHPRSGSKGASRIFRYGYTDAVYVRMALAARECWAALEREAGRTLLAPTGQLTFGADLGALERALAAGGAPAWVMSASQARDEFPEIAAPGDAVFEPESAVIDAAACMSVLAAPVADATQLDTRVERIDDHGASVRITTERGTVDASVVIACPGAAAALLDRLAPHHRFATLEHVAYFRHRKGALPAMPIFIEHGEPAVYGLPTLALDAYKIAFHHAGAVVDPERTSLEPQAAAVDALGRAARRWLPHFDPVPVHVETCLYDNTPDEDFVLDRRGNVVIGAGTSGHGFKFGPLLGELLADLATGAIPAFDLARFSLDRPALHRA